LIIRVFNDRHNPNVDCHIHLADKIYSIANSDDSAYLIAVNKIILDDIINYISWVPEFCDTDCAWDCTNNTTATETCNTCNTCTYLTCNNCGNCFTCATCYKCICGSTCNFV
jgi:hypothetical protein